MIAHVDTEAELMVAEKQIRGGESQGAIERLRRLVDTEASLDALYMLGHAHLSRNDPKTAAECADRLVATAPHISEGHELLARSRLALDNSGAALQSARRAGTIAPDDPRCLQILGMTLLAEQRNWEATTTCERLLDIDPRGITTHLLAADIAISRDRWAQAELHCRQVLDVNPQHRPAQSRLQACLIKQGRQKEAARLGVIPSDRKPVKKSRKDNSRDPARLHPNRFYSVLKVALCVSLAVSLTFLGIIGSKAFWPSAAIIIALGTGIVLRPRLKNLRLPAISLPKLRTPFTIVRREGRVAIQRVRLPQSEAPSKI